MAMINENIFRNVLKTIKEHPEMSNDILDSYSDNQFKAKLKLLELRNKYFKSYKEDYKSFHKLIMDVGPVPLDILEKEIIKLL